MGRYLVAATSVCVSLLMALARPAFCAEPMLTPGFQPLDYSQSRNWVCGPQPCRDDLTATILESDGSTRLEPFRPAAHPLVDCFYVYPTVSHSAGILADPVVTADERRAVLQQAERFTSVCRLFAPLYRQVTVTSMQRRVSRKPSREEATEAARRARADVFAAWDYYLAHENHGRGVVLIGHSQGAGVLISLIQQRIDGAVAQNLLISAVLPGAGVLVPQGRETGVTFKAIPPCRSDAQLGCVISFNMVRAERPIPPAVISRPPGVTQVCTNPAALSGGPGGLRPYLSATGDSIIPDLTAPQPPWSKDKLKLHTSFVTMPGLYTAECAGDGAYLAVSLVAKPGDRRTGALTGDWLADGKPEPTMGLHLIDLNLAAGNLVEALHRQADAYVRRLPPAN
ncbi:MAG: hypothetical protein JWP23_2857 [Phenylobacterium sp.]|nr:hypothetical protein [Phenylobacterium sp.]